MSHLPRVSGKQAVKIFQKAGWILRGQVGSHMVLTKAGHTANLSVPNHGELAAGTLRKLIRFAGLEVDQFVALYRK
ncbi:MAG: type II toxin-antitoxin system HicA family toxin [Spirochaetales bacterium]|nr:type II toxin-antitoxin system HicA family toxin [Spirochaetales bacterium]